MAEHSTTRGSRGGSRDSSAVEAPHPGSQSMPRWNTAELIDAPRFTWRNWAGMLGPAILMGGSAIGGGEWLTGPLVTARFGGAMLWLATASILGQLLYNIEICRYTLYTGEPIFTGKFRTLPGPVFWVFAYLLLDFGAVFPYLASSAATPLAAVILDRLPDPKAVEPVSVLGISMTEKTLLELSAYTIFLVALIPLVLGGKIYNSLRVVMSFKIVTVFGFLLVLAFMYSTRDTWVEIGTGFFKVGNLPVLRGEDTNGNGRLDPGEDWDGDGRLDAIEPRVDKNKNGFAFDPGEFEDQDGDGTYDGDKVENVFVSLAAGKGLPTINLSVLGILCAMVAISGQGGLSNTPLSNYTRDQGWGMGHHVGAIPSMVGGHKLQLSHVGSVFKVNADSLVRWRRWYRHVMRDQMVIWAPACFIGLALPSMLSVQFLPRGVEAATWTAAGMTAEQVRDRVAIDSGASIGHAFWFMTLFCGFLVLAPSMSSAADGVIRRWVDVFWTASPHLREVHPRNIRYVYFGVLCGYAVFGLIALKFIPGENLMVVATNIFNYALGFSCWHALGVNLVLLPPELRPNWFVRIGMVAAGAFFVIVAGLTTYAELAKRGLI